MTAHKHNHKHNSENQGADLRDHVQSRPHFLRTAHRDWRVWFAVVLMLALMLVYVMSNDLSLRPGVPATQPMPGANSP